MLIRVVWVTLFVKKCMERGYEKYTWVSVFCTHTDPRFRSIVQHSNCGVPYMTTIPSIPRHIVCINCVDAWNWTLHKSDQKCDFVWKVRHDISKLECTYILTKRTQSKACTLNFISFSNAHTIWTRWSIELAPRQLSSASLTNIHKKVGVTSQFGLCNADKDACVDEMPL